MINTGTIMMSEKTNRQSKTSRKTMRKRLRIRRAMKKRLEGK